MKKRILDRYPRTCGNELIIGITTEKIEDLYNDFDKHTPYARKELDPDFADYLIDSASDVGKDPFIIQFRLATAASANLEERVKSSIYSYFHYLISLELRELSRLRRSSYILFSIGISILTASVWIDQKIVNHEMVIVHVFAEGLVVAAWVSLWNAIANLLVELPPHMQQIKTYQRISQARISFHDSDMDDGY